MDNELQRIEFSEEIDTIKVSLRYIVKSMILSPKYISKVVGIEPTRAWEKGDLYLGKQLNKVNKKFEPITRKRDFSLWEIDTTQKIDSKIVNNHIEYLLQLIESHSNDIIEAIHNNSCSISIEIKKESRSEIIGYDISPLLFEKLIPLCRNIIFRNVFVPAGLKSVPRI